MLHQSGLYNIPYRRCLAAPSNNEWWNDNDLCGPIYLVQFCANAVHPFLSLDTW